MISLLLIGYMEVVCLILGPTLTPEPCSHTFRFDIPTSSSIFIENVIFVSIVFFQWWIICEYYL